MPPEIPEYYRHLTERKSKDSPPSQPGSGGAPPPSGPTRPQQKPGTPPGAPAGPPPPQAYRAHTFALHLGEDWRDQTVYVLAGPATDGIQHNITITMNDEVPEMALVDFADLQIQTLEEELKGCRLLLKEPTQLDSGLPAYRAIFVWWPTEELRLYQEQLYVLQSPRGYVLTASFTKKTRKTLGPQVERMMRSFQPLT